MDFQSADYGVDVRGIDNYLQEINSAVLTKVGGIIRNCSDVEAAVKAGWVGTSADRFLLNLNKAAENMCETLQQLQQTFETEIKGIKNEMMDFDNTLVEEE